MGSQDQAAAAYGGFNKIIFKRGRQPIVSPMAIPRERRLQLESHLMLFFTGFSRISSDVAAEQIRQTQSNIEELLTMKQMVCEALNILNSETTPIVEFGELMHESWMIKRGLTDKISNSKIDSFYECALKAGASGGKICGAGAGGFLMLFVKPELQETMIETLSDLLHVPFAFEHRGTHQIFKG